ncbi:MAG: chromosomal replication initiator protein DnaA [Candidatus Improbicoccus pseudotrichonymphae]|uniref:Chromosomal replication initiator protein DnaA n=1 Tax=Candidatus Improbicoccus pseudotrichonymphae TaxID=3033792 RepID=A0AA48L0L0_9FIRM|nr:MAG: chromosomal replication initiator protein DnaA [Candidatus Improbicoccus pseudotrichonymphae]
MRSFSQVWQLILDFCKNKISDIAYRTWFVKIKPLDIDFLQDKASLLVPNDFHKKILENCYMNLLNEAFKEIFDSDFRISLEISDDSSNNNDNNSEEEFDYSEFSFRNFVSGVSNRLAYVSCIRIAEGSMCDSNPLLIYGDSGLGKTHLLYAIKNKIEKKHSKKIVTYIKGEDFTNELIDSIKTNTTLNFKKKYRNSDIFLIDDIQFIAGKESTQEEFFHTFNCLYEAKKQIIITSDKPPKKIKTLENRLCSRFEGGLMIDIKPPDLEHRIAIVKKKSEMFGIEISEKITEMICKKITENIRQIEGVLKKIKAYYLLTKKNISSKMVESMIEEVTSFAKPKANVIEKIINEVARVFDVDPLDVRSLKRTNNISLARHISIYTIREATQASLADLGIEFSGRNHSTMIYSLEKANEIINKNNEIKTAVSDIIKNIKNF